MGNRVPHRREPSTLRLFHHVAQQLLVVVGTAKAEGSHAGDSREDQEQILGYSTQAYDFCPIEREETRQAMSVQTEILRVHGDADLGCQ